jgi:uncharacterized protein YndB with AHSA1/START domain
VPPPYVIDFAGSFTLPAPPSRVWSRLAHVDEYESWWPWLKDVRVEGPGLVSGSTLDGTVAPPLPYRMRVRVTFVECVPPHAIHAAVVGDLQGSGRLLLRRTGTGTRADVTWTLELMQRSMRLVSRMGRPLMLWGQQRVVEATLAGFTRHLQNIERDED